MAMVKDNAELLTSAMIDDVTSDEDDIDAFGEEMAIYRLNSDCACSVLRKIRYNVGMLHRYQKILLFVVILFGIIHIRRMFKMQDNIIEKQSRQLPLDTHVVKEYNKQFHGLGEVNEISKHRNLLQSMEEKEIRKLQEGQKAKEKSAWILCSDKEPQDARFWPTIGNGHLATVVRSNTVFMNGLYNGNDTSTHRARIPAFISYLLANVSQPISHEKFCLNVLTGMYYEEYSGEQWSLRVNMYAHRRHTRLLVTEYILQTDGSKGIKLNFVSNKGEPSQDLQLSNGTKEFLNSRYVYGSILQSEVPSTRKTPVHIYYSKYSPDFNVPGSVKNTFKKIYLMAVSPFVAEARSEFQKGLEMYTDGTLETSHMKAWQEVWDAGRIDIHGNSFLARSVYTSLYYLYSAMPVVDESSWPFIGLSPGDLAHGALGTDYNGHVFWDQDTWMYPPILVLNANLGKILVKSRIRTLDTAYQNAEMYGLKGAMYPWESAFEGFNVSPAWQTTKYELHVTGDVAYGFQQYLMMTRDTELLQTGRLKEAIAATAEFWQSRLRYNKKMDRYELLKVMPPDEWNWPVNNSVYTNQLVKMNMLLPKYAFSLVKERAPKKYESIANKIYILEDNVQKYHPEFDGYNLSTEVKQGDAVLLGFPLNMPMSDEFRVNDLTFYEKVTPGGPAMTWGMFAVGWIETGHTDKAESLFIKQLLNQQEPFNVWTETAYGSGATNFITGQGGFLQSIIFGYGGLRITTDHIQMKCTTIPNTEYFEIKNLDYLGNSLDIVCGGVKTEVTLTVMGTPLTLKVSSDTYELHMGRTVNIPNQKFTITADTN